MKVLVVGANGQIGKHLITYLNGHTSIEARAMIRDEVQASFFKENGAEVVVCDLEEDVPVIAEAAKGCDALVFTAGSGPHTGKDKTLMVDLDGAVKTVEAAKVAGIKRYVMISSFDTTRAAIQEAPEGFAPYVVAKHYADEWLRATDLDYTIIHPGRLTNEEPTGKVEAAEKVDRDEVARADVAKVILAVLEQDATIGREFQVVRGDVDVEEAVRNL
ncbi:MAG TPA: SDR family oxidoreductase [Candidatus Pseudogracilibacillus intestinigallinarum]|uniref:SDR family oxidoreductase n=1 Tax=Candidatus Pseudogracilibacillus intestinigallinarum TaxID=2838742 RepID=A0A9D1PK75_9BACI|nr:SDR family oxidoreductase [Candidatus Pseudogracilibacillus intestinigallinarum]